jgi:molybdate transport system ATP-binding protein
MVSLTLDVKGRRGDFRYHWEAQLAADGITGVYGPNGAGKTTLLRVIAGLESAAEGRIALGETTFLDSERGKVLSAHQRPVGYVFQDARLLPHRDVFGNLRYASRRCDAAEVSFDEIIDTLDLMPLLHRAVDSLSGGERQRVAIARALLVQPQLMLLDEPMSAIDQSGRGSLLKYLRKVAESMAIPMFYVSHSLDEIVALSQQLMVCREGKIVAVGDTSALMQRTDLAEVATGAETGSVLEAKVTDLSPEYGLATLAIGDQRFTVPAHRLSEGDEVRLQIHARDVAIALERPTRISVRNILAARIIDLRPVDDTPWADVSLAVGDWQLRSRITRASADELGLRVGDDCYAVIKSASVEANPGLD